jgi:hypothetical protein
MIESLKRAAKAATAGVTAFVAWVGTATADGEITQQEYLALLAIPVAVYATWRVKNAPPA